MQRVLSVREPTSVSEALRQPEWKKAMERELHSIESNDTWDLVPRPAKWKVIGVTWIFKTKSHSNGTLDKLKARLVARGFSQRPGVDFGDTSAPTARMATIRIVFAIASSRGWAIFQMDVKSAFLNGDLKEEVYVEQPPGFQTSRKHMVYRLKKALYGLKQAPRAWNERIDAFLQHKLGFTRSMADPSLYFIWSREGSPSLCFLWMT